jgi:RNA polymerase subunit RPABC4/transcription elongation factor Spt4
MHCQNCGQTNTQASNFCRFCGTKFTQVQYSNGQNNYANNNVNNSNAANYESAPPRPYSWKTDEYQISDNKNSKAKQISRVQPLADFRTQPDVAVQPFQQQQAISNNYHCPRCNSQLYPRNVRQISTGGWITFAVLLVTFFPLFWIGLLIKEDVRICPICNLKLN